MSQISTIIRRLQAAPVGLSQAEISRKTGIPQPRLSKWGAGKVPAAIDDAIKLTAFAKGKGVQIEEIHIDPALDAPLTESTPTTPIECRAEDRAMLVAMKGQGA